MRNIRFVFVVIVIILGMSITSCGEKKEKRKITLLPFEKNGDWGFVNMRGEVVIEPKFMLVSYGFREGLAVVHTRDGARYINEKGEFASEEVYAEASSFQEGHAFVVKKDSVPMCINQDFETVFVLPKVMEVGSFSEGMASFQNTEEQFGFVNKEGEEVVPAKYFDVGIFSEGLAYVAKTNDQRQETYAYINEDGDEVLSLPAQITYASDFHEGFAAIRQEEKWGFIDKDGQIVIEPIYEEVTFFNEGHASYRNGNYWGLINKKGEKVIEAKYQSALIMVEGKVVAELANDEGYEFLTADGKKAIDAPPYKAIITAFIDGVAIVKEGNAVVFINEEGKRVNDKSYENMNEEMLPLLTSYGDYFLRDKVLNHKIDLDAMSKHLVTNFYSGLSKQTDIKMTMNLLRLSQTKREEIKQGQKRTFSSDWKINLAPQGYRQMATFRFSFNEPVVIGREKDNDLRYNADALLKRITHTMYFYPCLEGKQLELAKAMLKALDMQGIDKISKNKDWGYTIIPLLKSGKYVGSIRFSDRILEVVLDVVEM